MPQPDATAHADAAVAEALRAVMREVAQPVVIVTARGREEARGITISSFTTVAMQPPMVAFNVQRASRFYDVITHAERFGVHVLTARQAGLAAHFALPDTPGEEQFSSVPHTLDATGLPMLDDCAAVLLCGAEALHPAGDSDVVLGRVAEVRTATVEQPPLLYHQQQFRTVGEEVNVQSVEPSEVKRGSSGTLYAPAPKNAKS